MNSGSRNQGPQGSVLPAGTPHPRQHPLASAPGVRIPRCLLPLLARPSPLPPLLRPVGHAGHRCLLVCLPPFQVGGPSHAPRPLTPTLGALGQSWLQPLCSDDPPFRASFPQPANQGSPACAGRATKPSGSKLKICIPPYRIPALRASGPPARPLMGDARPSGWKPPRMFSLLYHSQSVVLPSGSSPVFLSPGNTLCPHGDCLRWPPPVSVGFCDSLLLLSASCS